MKRLLFIGAISLGLALTHATYVSASDEKEGEQLYVLQCEKCHGAMYEQETGFREPVNSPRRIQLVMLDSFTSNAAHLVSRLIAASSTTKNHLAAVPAGEHLAVALPNGPALRGIIGRPAASVEGFTYSKSMLENMEGVVWSEETLDRWITNSQKWAPGSYMYYKQNDPEIRRKIILYLKASP